jgi:hypothetical protein
LYFDNPDAMNTGFQSPEGTAAAKDYAQIAPPGSRMFAAELD